MAKLITRLEQRLGVRLINRTTRRLALTAEGEIYLDRVREILGAIEAAESEVASARGSPRGHLRVHTFPVIAAHELAPALPEFLARHPHITFDFMVTHRSVDLVGKNVDVSLRIGPLENSGLVARKIVDLSRLICASPDWTSNSVNNTRTRLGGGKQLPRLDRFARKADPPLPAEEREQDLDPLVRLHAGVDPKLSSERPDRDLHARAHARTAGFGEFNQPVTLARPKLSDHVVGDMRRPPPFMTSPAFPAPGARRAIEVRWQRSNSRGRAVA